MAKETKTLKVCVSPVAYGQTRQEAIDRAQALALRVLSDRLEHGEPVPSIAGVFVVTP